MLYTLSKVFFGNKKRQFWFLGPCFKSPLSYKFYRPETIRDRAKMYSAVHVSEDYPENISSPASRMISRHTNRVAYFESLHHAFKIT